MAVEQVGGTRRQKQKEETRVAVLEAARKLFAEFGFENTTIKAIAAEAEVGFGTVFNHFPDKSSLLVAALLDDLKKTLDEALGSIPAGVSYLEKFFHLSKRFYVYYSSHVGLSRTLIKEMLFVEGEWGERLKYQYSEYLHIVSGLVDEGKSGGYVRRDIDSNIAAGTFFSLYYSVLLQGLSSEVFDPDVSVSILKAMVVNCVDGIGLESKS